MDALELLFKPPSEMTLGETLERNFFEGTLAFIWLISPNTWLMGFMSLVQLSRR